jgi:hypothetical protein
MPSFTRCIVQSVMVVFSGWLSLEHYGTVLTAAARTTAAVRALYSRCQKAIHTLATRHALTQNVATVAPARHGQRRSMGPSPARPSAHGDEEAIAVLSSAHALAPRRTASTPATPRLTQLSRSPPTPLLFSARPQRSAPERSHGKAAKERNSRIPYWLPAR